MKMLKETLRQRCLNQRDSLPTNYVHLSNQAIFTQLIALKAFIAATLIHTYVAAKTNEVGTHKLIKYAFAKHKRIAVPVVDKASLYMTHAEISTLDQLYPGHFGLLQPNNMHNAWIEDLAHIDLVLVPGLAFDQQGNRLGFGKGYYDRFLEHVSALKVGLVPEVLLLDHIPHASHDVRMDIILTEKQTYHPSLRS